MISMRSARRRQGSRSPTMRLNIFKVEDNQMSQYPPIKPIRGITAQLAADWEILETFFSLHNIEPHWDNCGYVWGWYDPDLAGWTGCMGKV